MEGGTEAHNKVVKGWKNDS